MIELKAEDSFYSFTLDFFFGDDNGYAVLSFFRKGSNVIDYGHVGAPLRGKSCKALRDPLDIFADLKIDASTKKLSKDQAKAVLQALKLKGNDKVKEDDSSLTPEEKAKKNIKKQKVFSACGEGDACNDNGTCDFDGRRKYCTCNTGFNGQ